LAFNSDKVSSHFVFLWLRPCFSFSHHRGVTICLITCGSAGELLREVHRLRSVR
jgi:hypothetical protein